MCYVICKNVDKEGCIAIKAEYGKELAQWKKSLYLSLNNDKVQLVTISRPSAYGEYAPYVILHSKEEFENKARFM